MGLFSKKPGGTFVGNLLRGAGNAIAPGILGTGKGLMPATTLSPSVIAGLGIAGVPMQTDPSQNNTSIATWLGDLAKGALGGAAKAAANTPEGRAITKELVTDWLMRNILWILAAITAISVTIYHVFFKQRSRGYKKAAYKRKR